MMFLTQTAGSNAKKSYVSFKERMKLLVCLTTGFSHFLGSIKIILHPWQTTLLHHYMRKFPGKTIPPLYSCECVKQNHYWQNIFRQLDCLLVSFCNAFFHLISFHFFQTRVINCSHVFEFFRKCFSLGSFIALSYQEQKIQNKECGVP